MEDRITIEYKVGEVYSLVVSRVLIGCYELKDEAGLSIYLKNAKGYRLAKGQEVKCRVLANTDRRPRIELVEVGPSPIVKVDAPMVDSLLGEVEWDKTSLPTLLLADEESLPFDIASRAWVRRFSSDEVPQVCERLQWLLEQSDLLGRCELAERDMLQRRLTLLVELLECNIEATRLASRNEATAFVDALFDRLRQSAYVYHPAERFNIMSGIFLSDHLLMEQKMAELMGILCKWDDDIWRKEPLHGALLRLLELFVNESINTVDRVSDNKSLVGTLFQVIAACLVLSGRTDSDAYRLYHSRLFTISTYLNPVDHPSTLGNALYNLVGAQPARLRNTLNDTAERRLLAPVVCAQLRPIDTFSTYQHAALSLNISPSGIALHLSDDDQLRPLIPESLGLWQHIQVMGDKKKVKPLSLRPSIRECGRLWTEVETELKVKPTSRRSATQQRTTTHSVGDVVRIEVVRRDALNNSRFHCRIVDSIGGSGTLAVDDIVPYTVSAELRHFQDQMGQPLLFEADIVEQVDGLFRFSMLDGIKYFFEEETPGTILECSLGSAVPPNSTRRAPAISREGLSVSLVGFDECDEGLQRGDVVRAMVVGPASGQFHLNCNYIEAADSQEYFLGEAFRNLLKAYALPEEERHEAVRDEPENQYLEAAQVRELVRIVDRMASLDAEYLRAYNYLGLARVLSLMLTDEAQAAYYRGRMELIAMLHDFAVNDTVDVEKLQTLQTTNADIFCQNSLLHDKFVQLQTVSYMGDDSHDEDLWHTYTSSTGLVHIVASLVLAYNMARRNGMLSQSNDILNRIKQTLRLQGYESNLRTYGSGIEDERTEYKTSIVYPPDEGMRPNPARQMKNILKVIASFLNTHGGKLYIGVNDAGAGVGIEDDLKHPDFAGDKDRYQRSIIDAVALAWGNAVAPYVDTAYDLENTEKDILVVNVHPYEPGVEYEGGYWVRAGSTKRLHTPSEFARYNKHRV